MPERCPYLDYRREDDDHSFDCPRAYCGAAETFVQAMRADICNRRYGLDPASDCEIYAEAECESGGSRNPDRDDADGDSA